MKLRAHLVQYAYRFVIYALAQKFAIERDLKNNPLIVLVGLTLETQALFILTTLELRT